VKEREKLWREGMERMKLVERGWVTGYMVKIVKNLRPTGS
jgi:hypothetical protein